MNSFLVIYLNGQICSIKGHNFIFIAVAASVVVFARKKKMAF